MYRLSYDDLTLYDPRDEDNAIRDTELHLGVNEAGSFRFTIESGHPYAAKLQKIAGTLELQSDDTHLFIADSGTRGSGNLLYYGELTQATTISENCMPKFAEKAISITLTSSDLS